MREGDDPQEVALPAVATALAFHFFSFFKFYFIFLFVFMMILKSAGQSGRERFGEIWQIF